MRDHLYTIYAASRSGGLWKTSNGGVTWAPISDSVEVAAVGAVGDAFDVQARSLADEPARAAGGDERMPLEDIAVADRELDQGGLFGVVGDEGEHGSGERTEVRGQSSEVRV